jgi:hypothetical protein
MRPFIFTHSMVGAPVDSIVTPVRVNMYPEFIEYWDVSDVPADAGWPHTPCRAYESVVPLPPPLPITLVDITSSPAVITQNEPDAVNRRTPNKTAAAKRPLYMLLNINISTSYMIFLEIICADSPMNTEDKSGSLVMFINSGI